MAKTEYCCELMARWVSDPRGANAPPETMLIEEYDMPDDELGNKTTSSLNTPLDCNPNVLIHRDQDGDYGLLGRANWGGHYLGIAYCPFCGTPLDTDDRVVGKMMMEFSGQYSGFDERECSLDNFGSGGDDDLNFHAEQAGLTITKDMSSIEILIRLQGYRDKLLSSRYSNSIGRTRLDFDKEWPPKELAAIAQFCAEHGRTRPDLALWKLLRRADQPGVWALALLDLAAKDIPGLHNIYFELRSDGEPGIVIEGEGLKSKRELANIVHQGRKDMSVIRGYAIGAGEPPPYDDEIKRDVEAYRKLQNVPGFIAGESNIDDGVLRYRVSPYYRDDVLTFLAPPAH